MEELHSYNTHVRLPRGSNWKLSPSEGERKEHSRCSPCLRALSFAFLRMFARPSQQVSYHRSRSHENRGWRRTHLHWFHSGGHWSPCDSDSGNPKGNVPDPAPPRTRLHSHKDYWPHRVGIHSFYLKAETHMRTSHQARICLQIQLKFSPGDLQD